MKIEQIDESRRNRRASRVIFHSLISHTGRLCANLCKMNLQGIVQNRQRMSGVGRRWVSLNHPTLQNAFARLRHAYSVDCVVRKEGCLATAEHDESLLPMIGLVSPILCSVPVETGEIRKLPKYKAPAIQLTYDCTTPTVKQSNGLPIGSQAKFIRAARVSADRGQPLNTLLSVRWVSLREYNNSNHLFSMSTSDRISYLVELIRKWIAPRCRNGFSYIWVRESVKGLDEHWHLGFYLPAKCRQAFAVYLGNLFGEPVSQTKRRSPEKTDGEFACSEWSSWHLARDTRPKWQGYYIAAYLGKGEPSQREFRGKLIDNTGKPVRGVDFGGREKTGKYDDEQGVILGTAAMSRRFDMARALKK